MTENERFTLTYKQIGEYWDMGIVDHQTKEPFDESKYEFHQTSFQASKDEMEDLCQLMNELNDENEKLKQSEKDCQELNHKLINENDELEQEIRKFKRIIDKLEVERCEYLIDKQARSKWGDNYD